MEDIYREDGKIDWENPVLIQLTKDVRKLFVDVCSKLGDSPKTSYCVEHLIIDAAFSAGLEYRIFTLKV